MNKIVFFFIINILYSFLEISAENKFEKIFKEGNYYLNKKKYEEGIKILIQVPETNKFFPLAYANVGMAYYNLGADTHNNQYYQKAEKIYKYLITRYNDYEKYDKNQEFLFNIKKLLGETLIPLGKYEESYEYLSRYNKYIKENNLKSDFIFLFNYGKVSFYLKKYNEADIYFLNAASLNTNNAFLYYYLGNTSLKLMDYQNAKKYYLKAYDKDRFLPDNNIALGLFLLDVEKNPKGKHLIIHGLKDKEYFKLLGINRQKEIFKYLSINKIYYVYDYHYSKFKAFYLTFYIMYLKNKMLYNIIFSCLIILTILIILHKKKILKLKTP